MNLRIDPKSHVPIYLQIVEGIRAAVASGLLRPGEPVPSLRGLGVELKVNPNTVQRAFDELEREGVIYARRGVGMFVAEREAPTALEPVETSIVETFRRGIQAGREANLPLRRLRQLFDHALGPSRRAVGGKR